MALVAPQGRLYFLDAAATAIALVLVEGKEAEVAAERLADAAGISKDGARSHVRTIEQLLWPRPPSAEHGRKPKPTACCQAFPVGDIISVRHYGLLDQILVCRFADQACQSLADAALGHLATDRTRQDMIMLDVRTRGERIQILQGGVVLEETDSRNMAVSLMRLVIADACLARSDDEWAVHAAAVAHGDKAVLLPGPSGKGKSTLTLGLGAAGYTVLADDTVVLAKDSFELRAIPFPICVKSGAWQLALRFLGAAGPILHGRRLDGLKVRWVPPSAGIRFATPHARANAQHMVFPEFVVDGGTVWRRLEVDEAVRRLIPGMSPLGSGLTAAKVSRLLHWVNRVACFELRYAKLEDGISAVRTLLR